MANRTYNDSLANNELVTGTASANQEQITGQEIAGANSATTKDSGWKFDTLKAWIQLDNNWMSKSVYDSNGDGRADNAEQLQDNAGGNTVTAAQARSHIDDSSIHFVLNDTVTAANVAWSSTKISSELSAKIADAQNVGTGEGNVYRNKTGTDLNLKTLKQAGNITITDNVSDITISTDGEANQGANTGSGQGNIYGGKTGLDLRFKTLRQAGSVTITEDANEVTISASGGATDLTDAQFPTWAGFVNQGSTAISVGGTTNVNFSASNKHALTGSGSTTIGTLTFPQANAHYFIVIPSTITIAAVSATGKQEYGQNDLTAGKAHLMAIYWDGTTAHWQTSEEP